jgi:hypothetical protein
MNKQGKYMKRGSTILLRVAVVAISLVVLLLCILSAPAVFDGEPGIGHLLPGAYLAAIPFFYALYQTLKLLGYIDKNQAFTLNTITALKKIKYCALIISGIYTLLLPFLFQAADKDDAPGLFALGLILVGAAFVIATSAGVLQKLVQNAVDLKSENDLTV